MSLTFSSTNTQLRDSCHRPEKSRTELLLAMLVGAFGILAVLPCFRYTSLGNDESITLQGATRVLSGQLPYRDFFSFYTPGSYYLFALVFRLFGSTFEGARGVLVVYAGLYSGINYLLARRVAPRSASLFISLMLGLIALPTRFQTLHNWDSTAFALLSLYFAVLACSYSSQFLTFCSGVFCGITLMIDQERGGGLILGFVIAISTLQLCRARPLMKTVALFSTGFSIPMTCILVYFASAGGMREMLTAWVWPLTHYRMVNRLPYGHAPFLSEFPNIFPNIGVIEIGVLIVFVSLAICIGLLPILALGVSLREAYVRCKQHAPLPRQRTVIICFSILFGLFCSTLASGRPDSLRIIYLTPFFLFLLAIGLNSAARIARLSAFVMTILFVFSWFFHTSPARSSGTYIDTMRGRVKIAAEDNVLAFVETRIKPGSHLFIYPYAGTYYFLTGAVNPTSFDFLQVGMHTDEDFESARRQLEKERAPAVLFELTFREVVPRVWPQTPLGQIARDPLGDFILRRYKPCAALRSTQDRRFSYMVRKDLQCPD